MTMTAFNNIMFYPGHRCTVNLLCCETRYLILIAFFFSFFFRADWFACVRFFLFTVDGGRGANEGGKNYASRTDPTGAARSRDNGSVQSRQNKDQGYHPQCKCV